ncbi:hypothetical protein Q8F55_006592 [Vanrija albida]|uniref:Protein kinase domain-containing protein n=1 Tax=Vanrija albida TaxID=181172 RepID=A0ABR3PXX5_9TREE
MLHQVRAPSPFDAASLPPRGSSIAAAVAAAAATATGVSVKRSSSVPRLAPAPATPQPRTASHPPVGAAAGASRNDLFNTSWGDTPTPPPPPRLDVSLPSRRSRTPPPPVVVDHIPLAVSPASLPTSPGYLSAPSPTSPLRPATTTPAPASKTSSFFASAAADTPPPAPKLAPPGLGLGPAPTPSPLSLSRASSLRARTLPSLPSPPPPPDDAAADDALSPLHQSPSLPSTSGSAAWQPPRPPNADDIQLRLYPEPAYLLGEGRYARAYLGAYKRVGRGAPAAGGWTLCAAKRLAADRESQTMGLREAFFLNRLKGEPQGRATSPLRERVRQRHQTTRGRVYVVKLIAVKEDGGDDAPARAHVRSSSDLVDGAPWTPSRALRHRSSTIYADGRQSVDLEAPPPPPPTANVSRLVLVLEHAPLGSLDRILRTSPDLVGAELWGRWAREAAEALEWVHSRGVVHADVKPSNLLLTDDLHLRLSDFGSSLLIHPAHPPTDGVGLGTLPFSPPELVDPAAPFSFPIDVFALGATLYQCITGREPYRGCRGVEMIHHVRNGGLWDWEERERLSRVGEEVVPGTAAGSPYPSAWRDDNAPIATPDATLVRRGGSLRVPGPSTRPGPRGSILPADLLSPFHVSPPNDDKPERPAIHRVGSAESIKASDDLAVSQTGDSPAGAKLWAAWKRTGYGADPIERLLRGDDEPDPVAIEPPTSPTPVSRASSLRSPTGPGVTRSSSLASRSNSLRSRRSPTSLRSPTSALDAPVAAVPPPDAAAYEDGAPAMFFLGAPATRVPDDVRDVLRAMLDPVASTRPTAAEVVGAWDELRVGVANE